MVLPKVVLILVAMQVVAITPLVHAEITAEQVRRSIDRGVRYLKSQQQKDGNWSELPSFSGGKTAICCLALLNAGVPVDDATIQRALKYLRNDANLDERTYVIALQTMVLCQADPKRTDLIAANVRWLEEAQLKTANEKDNGGWTYNNAKAGADPSNSQFALLALYEAERLKLENIQVKESTWRRAQTYWNYWQRKDGSWGYREDQPSSGSMTCAGIASSIITAGQIADSDANVADGQVQCCGPQADLDSVERGIEWLSKHFTVHGNPAALPEFRGSYILYYIYALERVGRMSGQRFIGQHDWYREGAEMLVNSQDIAEGFWEMTDDDRELETAYALLFLSKGKRPVLVSKLARPGNDWNHHRHDMANLTRHLETRWRKDMTWQNVDVEAATLEDLLQTPVLFLSGSESFDLTAAQKANLVAYINSGGFIFAEQCCGGTGFDRSFRALMAELFPDNQLQLLPPTHPIWYAEEPVSGSLKPLEGLDACCRTSVVYCPEDLSCYWELAGNRNANQYPAAVRQDIKSCMAIGANVMAYATNRELRDKLDIPETAFASQQRETSDRATLYVAKLFHNGGHDDAPSALTNLLRTTGQQLHLRVSDEKRILPITDANLPEYPIAFMHGRRSFRLSDAERKALRSYLENGGFLLADAICANDEFEKAFRSEMKQVFPDQTLERIAPTHPLLTNAYQGYDIRSVQLRDPKNRTDVNSPLEARLEKVTPNLETLELNGRVVVVFSPFDLSCSLQNQASLECKGYVQSDAAKIGVNLILFAMQQ